MSVEETRHLSAALGRGNENLTKRIVKLPFFPNLNIRMIAIVVKNKERYDNRSFTHEDWVNLRLETERMTPTGKASRHTPKEQRIRNFNFKTEFIRYLRMINRLKPETEEEK